VGQTSSENRWKRVPLPRERAKRASLSLVDRARYRRWMPDGPTGTHLTREKVAAIEAELADGNHSPCRVIAEHHGVSLPSVARVALGKGPKFTGHGLKPGDLRKARERRRQMAPEKSAAILAMLRAQLADREVLLRGRDAIVTHLHDLGLRRPRGSPLTWRSVDRWERNCGFPLLRGSWDANGRQGKGWRHMPATSSFAIVAWALSRVSSGERELFSLRERPSSRASILAMPHPSSTASAQSVPDSAANPVCHSLPIGDPNQLELFRK